MNILVIGSGGREHALVWKLMQSPLVQKIWCAPGNGGIAQDAECLPANPGDIPGLVSLAERLRPDLTVVGPELPLVLGIVDEFQARGLPIVGPSRVAAQLEGSKVFAKQFMERHGIPTAPLYGIYDDAATAYSALCAVDWPVVIKADGLCAGKGVLVASSPDDATAFIERLMDKKEFGEAGRRVILEEALEGEELSYIVMTDGKTILPLLPTQDHKRVYDGDQGPNTGGMGAYSMDGLIDAALEKEIITTIVEPTVRGLAEESIPYRGFLYFGLMLTPRGPKVLEFNCRMGDPETQPIVVRMEFDLAQACLELTQGKLADVQPAWKPGASSCVVIASGGYPGQFDVGLPISGLQDVSGLPGVVVFHSGTRFEGGAYYTSGGRVLSITAAGNSIRSALQGCYDACRKIDFRGAHYRKDIGSRAMAKIAAS
jgi:phosphoribosylamine--glycine ligase